MQYCTSLQFGLALEKISSNDDSFSYDRTPQFYPSESNGLSPPHETLKCWKFTDMRIAKQPEGTVTYLCFIVSVVRNKWLGLDKNAIAQYM